MSLTFEAKGFFFSGKRKMYEGNQRPLLSKIEF
jgi:hypothetical protein